MKNFWGLLFAMILFFPAQSVLASIDPQYIFVRKDNTCSNCYNWSGSDPSVINDAAIDEIVSKIGKGTDLRKTGVGVFFSYNDTPIETLKTSLDRLLELSLRRDFPVFIVLDGFQWWNNRPDLWNWYDPNTPGYNPANKENVEWTGWSSQDAVKKGWRNWGREIEVKPQPNISSDAFVNANIYSLTELVPKIVDWYNLLPSDKKYLLGGISTTVEQDIGANYYYYPNGVSNGTGLTSSIQQGYAAVKTANIKTSGTITDQNINEAIQQYQTKLNKVVYELGIPRNKIFNHNGGKGAAPFITYPAGVAFETLDGSLNNYAQPGWSFYGDVTTNPQNYPDLQTTLNKIGSTPWASPEWLPYAGDYNGWVASLRGTLNFRNNRFINVANWESIKDTPHALNAIKQVASESPACWVEAPPTTVTTNGDSVSLTWQKGVSTVSMFLNISNTESFTYSGTLSEVNVVNANVTTTNTYLRSGLPVGKYYWTLIADGCNNQRKISSGNFSITTSNFSGDTNNDDVVNSLDFEEIKKHFNTKYSIFDYNTLVSNYGKTTVTPTATPTLPSTITLTQTLSPTATLAPTATPVLTINPQDFLFGNPGDIPISGNWTGGKAESPAMIRGNTWYIKKDIRSLDADLTLNYNIESESKKYYLVCDWDGDGTKTPGIFSGGVWKIRNTNTTGNPDLTFNFGNPEDIPVCGNWTGTVGGKQTAGVVRNGVWYLKNNNSDGVADLQYSFGLPDDTPLVGRWTGTAQDLPAVYRSSNSTFYQKNTHTTEGDASAVVYGAVGDLPVIGDWDGDGKSSIGVVRGNHWYTQN